MSPAAANSRSSKTRAAAETKSSDSLNSESHEIRSSSKSRSLVLPIAIVAVGLGVIGWWLYQNRADRVAGTLSPSIRPIPAQYNATRAMGYLRQLCDLGPRPSGSPAMLRQQEILKEFFTDRGADVRFQSFETRHPEDGSSVTMSNLIASWHPNRAKRFLVCAHYDTRPYPDQDPVNPKGTFIGANDGASGTAGVMELANQLSDLPGDVGVDLVLFDAEEFIWKYRRDKYFLGSTYFAEKYRNEPPAVPYQAGILLDMIGDKELRIYQELNSLRMAKPQVSSIWNTARRLGVRAFVPRARHKIDDDHIPLNNIARIPTVDLIDFDYPRPGIGAVSYWHTEKDIPENCSGESIAAVVWVVHQWLKER